MTDTVGLDPRVEARAAWSEPVSRVRFVDGRRAEALERISVSTVGDLLRHFPHRHMDLSSTASLRAVPVGSDATVVGRVHEVKVKRPRKGLTVTEVALVDGTGVIVGVWFNQHYIADRFKEGDRVAFAGTVTLDYGLKQIRSPLVEKLGDSDDASLLGRVLPIHPTTEGLSANWLRRLVVEALDEFGDVPDPLPATFRRRRGVQPVATAMRWRHFPPTIEAAEEARKSLAYHEFFLLQLVIGSLRRGGDEIGVSHEVSGPLAVALRAALGFELTDDQEAALAAVLADMASPDPMSRLLLGDVGTGKTAVAAIAMAAAADGGHQSAMMAPTEVLAQQYAERVGPLLDSIGVTWVLLTGSTGGAERRSALSGLSSGDTSVAFGTHALFGKEVLFADLALTVIDEQHRFGVEQRAALRRKGPQSDLLVMTATPIPRTLALTLYGDLDDSYLRQRPSGRSPGDAVSTTVLHREERGRAYEKVREAAARGSQSFIVCPLVEESASADAKAVVDEADRLARDVFPELRVAPLTGRMTPDEKRRVMEEFRDGSIDVLVSTTVIEVGVDVPNATVMVVEDAERFGLAQLHQLRGRVGRSSEPGEFLLFADPGTDEGRRRMAAIEAVPDGFELAEIDLELRGEGQILGLRQSGRPSFHSASLLRDRSILEDARSDARELLRLPEEDPVRMLALATAREEFAAMEGEWSSSG